MHLGAWLTLLNAAVTQIAQQHRGLNPCINCLPCSQPIRYAPSEAEMRMHRLPPPPPAPPPLLPLQVQVVVMVVIISARRCSRAYFALHPTKYGLFCNRLWQLKNYHWFLHLSKPLTEEVPCPPVILSMELFPLTAIVIGYLG